MSGLIVGVVSALVVIGMIYLVSWLLSETFGFGNWYNVVVNTICIVLFFTIIFTINYFDKTEYSRRIQRFEQTKNTIEESLNSETLSGYERVQLVQTAIEYNNEMLGLQWDSNQWYGWNINDNVQYIELIEFE